MNRESGIKDTINNFRNKRRACLIHNSCFLIREKGFTLLETIVYAGIFALVSVFLVRAVLNFHTAYRALQHERDVTAASRNAMETLGREIRQAVSIYTPTSKFDAEDSQISLESALLPAASETKSFVDFYLDNGRLYMKREGSSVFPLTSEAVRVNQFLVSRLVQENRESLYITLRIESRSPGRLTASSTVTTAFTPRSNY